MTPVEDKKPSEIKTSNATAASSRQTFLLLYYYKRAVRGPVKVSQTLEIPFPATRSVCECRSQGKHSVPRNTCRFSNACGRGHTAVF